MIKSPRNRSSDPTLTLINVVFLMLTFFLLAGTIAPRPQPKLRLLHLHGAPLTPPDTLAILSDGSLIWQGKPATVAQYLAGQSAHPLTARLMPDADLPAVRLVEVAHQMRKGGAAEVRLVAERALP